MSARAHIYFSSAEINEGSPRATAWPEARTLLQGFGDQQGHYSCMREHRTLHTTVACLLGLCEIGRRDRESDYEPKQTKAEANHSPDFICTTAS